MNSKPLQPNVMAAGSVSSLSLRFWLLVPITGVSTGIAGGLLMKLLRAAQHFAWDYSQGEFLDAVEQAGFERRLTVLILAGLIAGIAAWWLAHEPGGHAGELAEAIWFRSGDLPFWKTAFRGCLSIVLVAIGASLGREAAPKQTGAAIASVLGRWRRLAPTERRLLAACGAGAGIAAVYNVPFGGAVFALEVLLGTVKLPLLAPMLVSSVSATCAAWLFLPNQPTYAVPAYALSASQVLWATVAGPLAGLAATAYVRAISWADGYKPRDRWLLLSPVLVFATLGLLALQFPQLLGNGRGVVQQAFVGHFGMNILVALVLLKPLATCACLGSGAPGGLFTPTLAVGALFGALFGQAWLVVWPGEPSGPYAIIGAGAVLAAATQGPISALVLIVELTRHVDFLLVPLLVAIAGAVMVARPLERRSIYSGRIHAGRATASESGDEHTISAAAGYAEVLHRLLLMHDKTPLRVIDEEGKCVGVISTEALAAGDRMLPLPGIATARDLATSA